MGRYFDANAALAEIQGDAIHPIHTIPEVSEAKNRTNSTNSTPPTVGYFEERAAIAEFDGGLTRDAAEHLAARSQGYDNVVEFRAAHTKSIHRGKNDKPEQK